MKLRFKFVVRSLLIFIAILYSWNLFALKIDKTTYRFCVMDDAKITDEDALAAERAGRLPSFFSAYWYSYNGVKINGTNTDLKISNTYTDVNVLMTETYEDSHYGLSHKWVRGDYGPASDHTTYFDIYVDAPSGVSLDKLPSRMLIGEEMAISPQLLGKYTAFSGNGYFDYSYTSSDEETISISSGKITALKSGNATITVEVYAKNKKYSGRYYIGSATADIEVTGNMDPTAISLSKNDITLNVGEKTTLSATLTPEDAKTEIQWKSSDENVATIDNGSIEAVGRGTAVIEVCTSNGLSAKCNIKVLGEEDYHHVLDINDVNRTWGTSRAAVMDSQTGNYYLLQNNKESIVYTTNVEDNLKIYLSYKFDKNDALCASTLSFPETTKSKEFAEEFFSQYDKEVFVESGVEVKAVGKELIAIDYSSLLDKPNMITLGFSYYEPLEERDDCVDLGLSVRWATTNLGADTPEGIGDFYAWSELNTKSEYWRENYSYCNNNANQYIFVYTNPTANICGTQYDVATVKLGEGWKMPSLAEANELISMCTWEAIEINGTQAFRVTGPNGNSIILPRVGWKKQNKEYSTTKLYIATGEAPSKSSEGCYTLSTDRNGKVYSGTISQEWKAWGYNIRPVYTK